MAQRYKKKFAELESAGRKAFIPFTMLGWPNPDRCFDTVKAFIDGGASALELGIAFSDPVADGPIIQQAACETIESGFTPEAAFELLERIRVYNDSIPIGLLVYYNTVLSYGVERFYQRAHKAGVDGVLIADLPPEAGNEVTPHARENGVEQIFIASTLTTGRRLKLMLEQAGGFIYVVSRLGITGVEEKYDKRLQELLSEIKRSTDLPALVGFGISTPENVQYVCGLGSDGAIVGSRIIQIVRNDDAKLSQLIAYVQQMANAASAQECAKKV